jgi:DNA repair protein SbcD/Mre11
MKVLHTSDWHLGRALYGHKRDHVFSAFLDWLVETVNQEQVEVLLVAGDVFDSTTPSHRAQELYYRFLRRVSLGSCRHVVVVAGNHDSPSFLEAPQALLKAIDVHVVGAVTERLSDEVLVLRGSDGVPELVVCAVPYLRDRDLRVVDDYESREDKDLKITQGIRNHYAQMATLAEVQLRAFPAKVPVIAMGHLFTAGGQTVEGDGVRELYVGSLAHVNASIFPELFDYVALGHLHVPQRVGKTDRIRYSGSPIPIGFGEAHQVKSVCRVDLGEGPAEVRLLPVPLIQRIERIRGAWDAISDQIRELAGTGQSVWIEVVYAGQEICGDLRERVHEAVSGSKLEVLRIRSERTAYAMLEPVDEDDALEDLDPVEVFERCLTENEVPEEQKEMLRMAYQEVLAQMRQDETQRV